MFTTTSIHPEVALRWTGGGYGGFIVGIPARDLTPAEVESFGEVTLLESGLYARPESREKPRRSRSQKEGE